MDEYIRKLTEKDETETLPVNDARFPSLIASAMYESSRVFQDEPNEQVAAKISKIAQNIDNEQR